MNFTKYISKFDRSLWIRFFGEVFIGIGYFMIMPFISIYLYDKLRGDIILVGIIMAIGPLASSFGSIFGGYLADKWGRKPTMILSLAVNGMVLVCIAYASSALTFAFLNMLSGLFNSLYYPAATAMVADTTPEKDRLEAYGLLRIAGNIGAAIGPLIGVYVFYISKILVFLSTALIMFIFSVIIIKFIKETKDLAAKKEVNKSDEKVYLYMIKDKIFVFYMMAGILMSTAYSQTGSMLPVHFKINAPNLKSPYAFLMAINGFMVVLFQVPITKYLSGKTLKYALFWGCIFQAIGLIGVGYFRTMLTLAISFIVFTLGECYISPTTTKLVADIAPVNMRGRYMGVAAIQWVIGGITAPTIGGIIMKYMGGEILFLLSGIVSVLAGLSYVYVTNKVEISQNILRVEGSDACE